MIGSGGSARSAARSSQVAKRQERREVEAGGVELRHQRLEGGAALGEGQRAEVAVAVLQEVVGAQVRRVAAELRGGDGLAVQPLLQVGEGGDRAVVAADQQLAVEGGVEVEGVEQVGEGAADVVAGARVEPAAVGVGGGLDADAVPLPLGGEVGRVEAGELGLVERMRQHDRAERGGGGGRRARAGAGQPGEEPDVGGREAVPELLDLGDVAGAEVGERLLGEPRRDADAEAAGDELQEREAARGVEPVEQPLDHLRRLAARGGAEALDHLGERRVVGRRRRAPARSARSSRRGRRRSRRKARRARRRPARW